MSTAVQGNRVGKCNITGEPLTADVPRRIQAIEMRCYRRVLGISYKDHITSEEVRRRMRQIIGSYQDLLATMKRPKRGTFGKWSGHCEKTRHRAVQRGGRWQTKQKWADCIQTRGRCHTLQHTLEDGREMLYVGAVGGNVGCARG